MRKKAFVGVLLLSMLVMSAGLASVQKQKRFGAFVPPEQRPVKVASQKLISTEYNAVLLTDQVAEPWGIGVPDSGDQVYVNSPYYNEIWKYESGSASVIMNPSNGPSAGIYRLNFGLYLGDNIGDIYHYVLEDDNLKLLASLGLGYYNYPAVTALTVDPVTATIYFFNQYSQNLYRLPNFDGHTPQLIAHLPLITFGLAIKGNVIYISEAYGGRIYKMPKSGGKLTLFMSGFASPCGIEFDQYGNLFVADYVARAVARVRRNTKKIEWIGSGFETPFFIAVDGKGNVYFTDFGAGEVWELTRKDITIR